MTTPDTPSSEDWKEWELKLTDLRVSNPVNPAVEVEMFLQIGAEGLPVAVLDPPAPATPADIETGINSKPWKISNGMLSPGENKIIGQTRLHFGI